MALIVGVWNNAAGANRLVVTMTNGEKTEFKLADNPIATIDGDVLLVTCSESVSEFILADVKNFTYMTDGAGADDVEMDVANLFSYHDNIVRFDVCEQNRNVSITDIAGIVMLETVIDAGQICELSVATYSPGIYLVTVNGCTTKITKR